MTFKGKSDPGCKAAFAFPASPECAKALRLAYPPEDSTRPQTFLFLVLTQLRRAKRLFNVPGSHPSSPGQIPRQATITEKAIVPLRWENNRDSAKQLLSGLLEHFRYLEGESVHVCQLQRQAADHWERLSPRSGGRKCPTDRSPAHDVRHS